MFLNLSSFGYIEVNIESQGEQEEMTHSVKMDIKKNPKLMHEQNIPDKS